MKLKLIVKNVFRFRFFTKYAFSFLFVTGNGYLFAFSASLVLLSTHARNEIFDSPNTVCINQILYFSTKIQYILERLINLLCLDRLYYISK